MKIFAFILAVLVFALSCFPCMDGPYAMNSDKTKIENRASQNQKEHHDADACSPFCTCNCCAGFTFLSLSVKEGYIIHVAAKFYPSYFSSSAIEISLPVWQPPKLS